MMLREVHHGRQKYTHLYLPPFADRLEHESRVWNTTNPRRLLQLANERGDSPLDRQRRHEALRFFDESRALAHMEERHPIEAIQDKFEDFISSFTADLFEPGSDLITVYTYHDRADLYRVKQHAFMRPLPRDACGDLLERGNPPITCRLFQHGGGHFFVALRDRVKEHFDTWLKMQKQTREDRPNPHEIRDLCGLRLIAPDIAIAEQLLARTRTIIEGSRRKRTAGKVVELVNNLTEDVTAHNRHSSRFFRAARLRIIWNGIAIEIQITTFQHYYSSILAVGRENHEMYRLLQCFDHYFPFLFPTAIYGIDWDNERIRRQLMALRVAHFGWRVDRDTLPVHEETL